MAEAIESEDAGDPFADLEAATDRAIAECSGNARAAVMALIVVNECHEAQLASLQGEVERLAAYILHGEAQAAFHRRLARGAASRI